MCPSISYSKISYRCCLLYCVAAAAMKPGSPRRRQASDWSAQDSALTGPAQDSDLKSTPPCARGRASGPCQPRRAFPKAHSSRSLRREGLGDYNVFALLYYLVAAAMTLSLASGSAAGRFVGTLRSGLLAGRAGIRAREGIGSALCKLGVLWGAPFALLPSRPRMREGMRTYSGSPCQETPCLPPGCPGCLGFRWSYPRKRQVPWPKIDRPPGGSGLGFLRRVSCGRAPIVYRHSDDAEDPVSVHDSAAGAGGK